MDVEMLLQLKFFVRDQKLTFSSPNQQRANEFVDLLEKDFLTV